MSELRELIDEYIDMRYLFFFVDFFRPLVDCSSFSWKERSFVFVLICDCENWDGEVEVEVEVEKNWRDG